MTVSQHSRTLKLKHHSFYNVYLCHIFCQNVFLYWVKGEIKEMFIKHHVYIKCTYCSLEKGLFCDPTAFSKETCLFQADSLITGLLTFCQSQLTVSPACVLWQNIKIHLFELWPCLVSLSLMQFDETHIHNCQGFVFTVSLIVKPPFLICL